MRQRKWQNTFRFLPSPHKNWLLPLYAFALGAFPAIMIAASTGNLNWLPILIAFIIWFGCLVIWFIAERLI